MKDLLVLLVHLLTTIAKLLGPGGARAIVADSLLMKQQLLVINRSRRRAPNLSALDRFLLGFWSLFLSPHRIRRAAVILRPSTLLNFHDMLKKRKYRMLYSSSRKGKPGQRSFTGTHRSHRRNEKTKFTVWLSPYQHRRLTKRSE
jgi:hypothetical protein